MKRTRITALAAALCLVAIPASASAGGPPAGVPGAANAQAGAGGGATSVPSLEHARTSAAQACRQVGASFDSRQEFGSCVAAGTQARRSRITPHQACSGLGLSRKRQPGQRRSAFNACVVAAAHGTREGEEGTAAPDAPTAS